MVNISRIHHLCILGFLYNAVHIMGKVVFQRGFLLEKLAQLNRQSIFQIVMMSLLGGVWETLFFWNNVFGGPVLMGSEQGGLCLKV